MQALQPDSTLQGGKYRIIEKLGQGGFGITYLAENTMLEGMVAIKEFFFKEYCERDDATCHVTIPTTGNREIVERFKQKFIKEAKTIFRLNHPNIVRIHDVFEENDTAYYVMDYIDGESLGDMVKRRGAIPEAEALGYVKDAASALEYIHSMNINHLDIKPGNLMKRKEDGRIIVIDFGVAKQYDAVTSEGTTNTPVGISLGYSPMEQYSKNGVQTFSPQSDVYALAATLFKLLTGNTPPESIKIPEYGLPVAELQEKHVSRSVIFAIAMAMKGRHERTQSVAEFINNLSGDDTVAIPDPAEAERKRKEAEEKAAEERAEAERKRKEAKAKAEKEKKTLKGKGGNIVTTRKKRRIKSLLKKYWWMAAVVVAIVAGLLMILSQNGAGVSGDNSLNDSITTNGEYTPNVKTFYANGVPFDMVEVRGGTFRMGATSEQGSDAWGGEKPVHSVTLSGYYIGKTEVTQALWKAVMGSNPSKFKGDNLPVEQVSWDDCQEFIRKLNAITGQNFHLPTEAEWEFACRGGNNSRGYKYSGSNDIKKVAWYEDNSVGKNHLVGPRTQNFSDFILGTYIGNTQPVGTKVSNELGIYDMSGNVCEWCNDWYGDYSSGAQTNPKGPYDGSDRVIRGGSKGSGARCCRSSSRCHFSSGVRSCSLGLRLSL